MMAPLWKISPPQTPYGSARSSAPARQAVRSGHCWQHTLACSSSSGSSENHFSPPPCWQGSRSDSVAGGGADPAPEALGMTILRPRVAPVRVCIAGTRGGTGWVRTAGELLGADDVVVAWICRQRLERPTGWTMVLADADLLHRDSSPVVFAGRRERPLRAPGADIVLLPLVMTYASVRSHRPGEHRPHSRSRDSGQERERPARTPADRLACLVLASDLRCELGTGGDAQLGEHVCQVGLDGPPGDEQPLSDLRVG